MVFRPGKRRGRGARHGALRGPFRPAGAGEYHGFIVADFGANSNRRGRGGGNGGGARFSPASGSAGIGRRAGQSGVVRRPAPPGGAFYSKLPFPLPGRRWGAGKSCAKWPRHRPPPHATFRTRCTPTVQRVRSEAHYAAAVPRLAWPASCGGQGETGQSAAPPCRIALACPFPSLLRGAILESNSQQKEAF